MTRLCVCLALVLALPACTTASMRREMDVSGTLPKLIGLGGFAPSCFLFCFIENNTTQGDVIRDEAGPEDFSVRSLTQEDVKVKPKPKHLHVKPVPAK